MNADSIEDRSENWDNLQEILGIGPDYERDLERAGIGKFAQLAKFRDAQHLHKALKKAGIEIPLWRIEKDDWINQARKKVKYQEVPPAVEETVVSKRDPNQATSTIEPWKEYFAFIVSFDRYTYEDGDESWRTRVYKSENGDEIIFEGTSPSTWNKWIYEQAKLPIIETQVAEAVDAEKFDLPETELVITHVPTAEIGKQLNLVNVQIANPSTTAPQRALIAQIQFELLGSEVKVWTEEEPSYRLELYLLDLENRVMELVTSIQKQLEPGILEYELGEAIPIPSPGRYELYALLFSLPPTAMMVSHQGPIINVLPHPVTAW